MGHGVANMFRDANEVPNVFLGGGREFRIMPFAVNFLPEVKTEQRTDVIGDTSEGNDGDLADGGIIHVVQEQANVEEGKEPGVRRCIDTVHEAVDCILHSLPATLSRVLLLLVRFTLPRGDEE